MIFRNLTCLKKVWDKQAITSMSNELILFNDSRVSLDGNVLKADIKDDVVLFLAKSDKQRKETSTSKRVEYDINISWIECYQAELVDRVITDNFLHLVLITQSVYEALKLKLGGDHAIYAELYKLGVSQLSTDLRDIDNFCAVTCSIVE